MRHSRNPRRGRARDASAAAEFERALLGSGAPGARAFDPTRDRKPLQLCRQVQRALALALPGECDDELLRDACVESVEPLGGPGQLLVRVSVPAGGDAPTWNDAMARLTACTPRLRAAIAREISRKRVPNLSFVVVPRAQGGDVHEH